MLPPRSRVGLVAVLAIVLAAGCLATTSGCGRMGRTLSQRSLEVIFTNDHTAADVSRVRARCDGVGGAKASRPGKVTALNRRYPLRFDVTGLSLLARSRLLTCLSADRAVRGYTDSESTAGS